ncbi:helix-hairpin-helix domain-containing protein [Methylomonas sp. LL1]|uniref:ComEA family DNA-binding protein n=1 Tax=Methylomonas sp. LL1 TaxID=2785785 RepID=UPI0018C43D4E|nr:helix-hairpin-helix domain-containing protein [Methylomonas sp. LL1]QPK62142.1 helix-hairpin-helix domain-containing protein [Methylomonas sp. LL1]
MKKFMFILLLCPLHVLAEPVNINQADPETISKALTGIGPKKAEAIVQYRKEHGDFESLKDLEKVSGIGEKTIQANEKDILFTGNSAESRPVEKVAEPAKKEDTAKKTKQ